MAFDLVCLSSNPLNTQTLDTRTEFGKIKLACEETDSGLKISSCIATVEVVSKTIMLGSKLLHFSGHGVKDKLYFEEGQCGKHRELSGADIKLLIPKSSNIEFLFLSACECEEVGKILSTAIPHVVAIRQEVKISEKIASQFAYQFYFALFTGRSIQDAFDIAKNSVRLDVKDGNTDLLFVLLPEGSPAHAEKTFCFPHGKYQDMTAKLAPADFEHPPSHFVGRRDEISMICGIFANNKSRLVSLIGEKGTGKSALAQFSVSYMHERSIFERIMYIPFGRFISPLDTAYLNTADDAFYSMNSHDRMVHFILKLFERFINAVDAENQCTINTIEQLISVINEFPPKKECKCLFVLDSVEHLIVPDEGIPEKSLGKSASPGEENTTGGVLLSIINAILLKCKRTCFLVTSSKSLFPSTSKKFLQNETEIVVPVVRFTDSDTAMLFIKRTPRPIQLIEMGGGGGSSQDAYQRFTGSPVIRALEGNPGAVIRFVSMLKEYGLPISASAQVCNTSLTYLSLEGAMTHCKESLAASRENNERHERILQKSWVSVAKNGNFTPKTSGSASQIANMPVFSFHKSDNNSRTENSAPSADDSDSSSEEITPMRRANSEPARKPSRKLSKLKINVPNSQPPTYADSARRAMKDQQTSSSSFEPPTVPPYAPAQHFVPPDVPIYPENSRSTFVPPVVPDYSPSSLDRHHWESPKVASHSSAADMMSALSRAKDALDGLIPDVEFLNMWAELIVPHFINETPSSVQIRNVKSKDLIKKLEESFLRRFRSDDESCVLEDGIASGDSRSLIRGDLPKFLKEGEILRFVEGKSKITNNPLELVSIDSFLKCLTWWRSLLNLVTVLRKEYVVTTPVLIHGFISKTTAEELLLSTRVPGVFLVRFSSKAGCAALSFTGLSGSKLIVTHTLIEVRENHIIFVVNSEKGLRFDSILELILKSPTLTTCYPDIPKEKFLFLN